MKSNHFSIEKIDQGDGEELKDEDMEVEEFRAEEVKGFEQRVSTFEFKGNMDQFRKGIF